jgi:hypothetical protein
MAAAIPTTPPAFEMVTLREDHQAVIEIKVVGQHVALPLANRGRPATRRRHDPDIGSKTSRSDSRIARGYHVDDVEFARGAPRLGAHQAALVHLRS